MKLTKAQEGLLITGGILLVVGFFFALFALIHRSEHKSHQHFIGTIRKAAIFVILGLVILLAGVYSKKKNAKKDVTTQSLLMTLFVIGIFIWGSWRSNDPVIITYISVALGLVVGGILISTILKE